MKILIVEDEKLARERLVDLVRSYNPEIEIVGQFDTIKDSVSFLQQSQDIDLIFLDIQLSDGLSFEIFNRVECFRPVIFTTAYDTYMQKAFELNSVDYLLKPINSKELYRALEKLEKISTPDQVLTFSAEQIQDLLSGTDKKYKKRFLVKLGRNFQFKLVQEIGYFFADGKIVYLVVRENDRKYIVDHTLEELENSLLDPEAYFRINRKYIIGLEAIADVQAYVNSRLKIKLKHPTDRELIVSREKVTAFKDWLNS